MIQQLPHERRHRKWTAEEDARCLECAADRAAVLALARSLGRSYVAVSQRRYLLLALRRENRGVDVS